MRRTVICAWRGRLMEADVEFVGEWATIYIEKQALELHLTEAPHQAHRLVRASMQLIQRLLLIAAFALAVACSGGGGAPSTAQTTNQTTDLSLIWDQGSWDTNTWN